MFGSMCALFLLTAMDLYGPARLFRLHVVGETFLPAAGIQLALLFPQPHAFVRWRFAGYGLSALILFVYELSLYHPAPYSTVLTINMIYLGVAGLFFGARLVWEYIGGRSQLVRQRVRVLTLGTLFGFALPGLIVLVSAIMCGGSSDEPRRAARPSCSRSRSPTRS